MFDMGLLENSIDVLTKEGAYLRFDNPKTILNHIIMMSDMLGHCVYLKLEDR